ncbi:F-box protein HRT3 [Nakaseomyces glabratus]|nr:F-box protein HRT3 [Nakaseomyces glabratus]KTB25876.1 F-box protein HRT3 [Nakaseomyces glabratus]
MGDQDAVSCNTEDTNPRADEALQLWEQGAAKEQAGSLMDAINFYRKALKVHDGVEKLYRKKLQEDYKLQQKLEALNLNDKSNGDTENTSDVNGTSEEAGPVDPCWILEMLPDDILLQIIKQVVYMSGESWVNLSKTCASFNKLCFHNSLPYQAFADYIYPKQVYDSETLQMNKVTDMKSFTKEIWGDDAKQMICNRPFIKYHGIYISVVNVIRYGANDEGSLSLMNPIHILTYYRYFRFYPDGSCLRLLTTDEPSFVVKHFSKETPIKDSEICRWSLGFDYDFGLLHITRTSDKYEFHEKFVIKNQGRKKHHQLAWLSSVVIDNEGVEMENSLKNERAFHFSRVKSYENSL